MGGQGPSPFGVPPGGGRGGATFLILMGVAPGSRVLRNSLGEVGEVQPPSSRETVEVAVVVAAVIFSQDQLLLVLENSMETEPQVLSDKNRNNLQFNRQTILQIQMISQKCTNSLVNATFGSGKKLC